METAEVRLAFVKKVAEAHGGNVSVESTQEKGTTFALVIPAVSQ